MNKLETNISNREQLIQALKNELIGPIPIHEETMIGLAVDYENTKDIFYSSAKGKPRKHYFNLNNNEEIIHNGNSPLTQYAAGILFPYSHLLEEEEETDLESLLATAELDEGLMNADKDLEEIAKRHTKKETTEEQDIAMNDKTPSSLAFTFYVATFDELQQLQFHISGGVYKGFPIALHDEEKQDKKPYNTTWWAREAVVFNNIENLLNDPQQLKVSIPLTYESLKLRLQLNIRQINNLNLQGYFVTASLTNISEKRSKIYKNALFQAHVKVCYKERQPFDPYPTYLQLNTHSSEEDLSNALLYYDEENYALGHGCSVEWNDEKTEIQTTFLPEHEITNITPEIKDANGQELKISMLDLADNTLENVQQTLSKITVSYQQWIVARRTNIIDYPTHLHETANKHLDDCAFALQRMENGIKLLSNPAIFKAFQLANLAMFIQQISGGAIRKGTFENNLISYDVDENIIQQLPKISQLKQQYKESSKGYWRAFQISFLLMSLPSIPKEAADERDIADLIWFPTGGGKTEAYLGVAATTILYRRLINAADCGTEIIMRYTLRLLTADQFQRSARLICALELLRKNHENLLGTKEISIGLCVGESSTPNRVEDAYKQLKEWTNTGFKEHEFLINHCPLCRCEMTAYKSSVKINNYFTYKVTGYKKSGRGKAKDLIIHCPNDNCAFHKALPIYLIDEQLYSKQPTFIIGTVDKFASLAWEPKARSLFGIGQDGNRELAPPSLIIQDELHLISGPLGSTVGIYETLIEELCTDYRHEITMKPKIICATATVRGYKEQIQALFNRTKENVRLFPSPGLSEKDSFFAQVHLEQNPITKEYVPSKGRKYIGLASNLIGIQQLQVKVYTTVLQTVKQFDAPDPYWTLLAFFNSIRELGGSLTLFQTDISNYILQFRNKHHITEQGRFINSIKELTSRLKNREVTNALAELKTPFGPDTRAIDVCLASNIIEVGVDVDRLSLMSIVGQPKNTAQYIQVSGRVGRAWYERPGLIMTLYKLSMSRDKSHFEHFKEYHQSLYKHVEATSVTPFSEPSIDRALAGVVIAWLRQLGDLKLGESPATIEEFEHLFDEMEVKILSRLQAIDHSTAAYFQQKFDSIKNILLKTKYTQWAESSSSSDYFYMYMYGTPIGSGYDKNVFPVLRSMRNVDASCIGTISNAYTSIQEEDE